MVKDKLPNLPSIKTVWCQGKCGLYNRTKHSP